MDQPNRPPACAAQVAALAALAQSVTVLSTQLTHRVAVSDAFVQLLADAKRMVSRSYDVRTSRWSFDDKAGQLADELMRFADRAAQASRCAAANTRLDATTADQLRTHAARIAAISGGGAGPPQQDNVRAALEPLQDALIRLQSRISQDRQAARDAGALAEGVAGLAGRSPGLREGGRVAEQAISDTHRALAAFLHEGTAIAHRLAQSEAALNEAAARVGLTIIDDRMVWRRSGAGG